MEARQQLEALGQTELVHRAHPGADDAKNDVDPEPLPNDAGAKAAIFRGIGKIDIPPVGELGPLCFVKETGCERRSVFRGQLRGIGPDRLKNPMKPPDGLRVDAEMDVGGAASLSKQKVLIDVRGGRRGDEGRFGGHGGTSPENRQSLPRRKSKSAYQFLERGGSSPFFAPFFLK